MNIGFLMVYAPKQIEQRGNLGWCYRCILEEEYYYNSLLVREGYKRIDENLGAAGAIA